MQLTDLLSNMKNGVPVPVQVPNPCQEVLGLYYNEELDAANARVLLRLFSAEEFAEKEFLPNDTGCIMVFGCQAQQIKKIHPSLPPRLNVIAFADRTKEQAVREELYQRFLIEQRISAGVRMIIDAYVEDRRAQHIAEAAYRILKNPIFINDMGNRYLAAVYDEDTFPEDGPFAKAILEDVMYRRVGDSGRTYIRNHKIDERLREEGVFTSFNERFQCEGLFGSVCARNVPVGRITMYAIEHPFTPFDVEMFRALRNVINQIMRKEDNLTPSRYDLESTCLADLLSSSFADEVMVKRSTHVFSFSKDCQYQIITTACTSETENLMDALEILIRELRSIYPTYPVTIMDFRLVGLVAFPGNRIPEEMWKNLRDLGARTGIVLGLSNVFQNYREARSQYMKACRAADLCSEFQPEKILVEYKDMIIYELLVRYQSDNRLNDLIVPEISQILQTDEKNGGEYLNTLSAYLRCFGKSQKICEELHIHKNTLLYRVERLKDTFGLKLDDGDAQMRYYLSLQILKILHAKHDILPEHIQL